MKKSSSRSRNFSLVTYLSREQLQVALLAHTQQIKQYAFAYHDKDTTEEGELKEPHFHIVLCLYNATSLSAVRRWFAGFKDAEEKEINTLGQVCSDIFAQYDYLTHNTVPCREAGKYQYPQDIIECSDKAYFRANDEYSADNLTLAMNDYLKGTPLKTLYRVYGRDFIIHYSQIKALCEDIKREETLFLQED